MLIIFWFKCGADYVHPLEGCGKPKREQTILNTPHSIRYEVWGAQKVSLLHDLNKNECCPSSLRFENCHIF